MRWSIKEKCSKTEAEGEKKNRYTGENKHIWRRRETESEWHVHGGWVWEALTSTWLSHGNDLITATWTAVLCNTRTHSHTHTHACPHTRKQRKSTKVMRGLCFWPKTYTEQNGLQLQRDGESTRECLSKTGSDRSHPIVRNKKEIKMLWGFYT